MASSARSWKTSSLLSLILTPASALLSSMTCRHVDNDDNDGDDDVDDDDDNHDDDDDDDNFLRQVCKLLSILIHI